MKRAKKYAEIKTKRSEIWKHVTETSNSTIELQCSRARGSVPYLTIRNLRINWKHWVINRWHHPSKHQCTPLSPGPTNHPPGSGVCVWGGGGGGGGGLVGSTYVRDHWDIERRGQASWSDAGTCRTNHSWNIFFVDETSKRTQSNFLVTRCVFEQVRDLMSWKKALVLDSVQRNHDCWRVVLAFIAEGHSYFVICFFVIHWHKKTKL